MWFSPEADCCVVVLNQQNTNFDTILYVIPIFFCHKVVVFIFMYTLMVNKCERFKWYTMKQWPVL